MVKKLIDTQEFMLLEISEIEIDGIPLDDDRVRYLPELPIHILNYIRHKDYDIDECINENPGLYELIVIPFNAKAYAAFYLVTERETSLDMITRFIEQLHKTIHSDEVIAYEFEDLCELEGFIKARVITKTDKSALYKYKNKIFYVTSKALSRLSEYFIYPQTLSICVLDEHGEKIINEDAFEKLCSYVRASQ